MTRPTRIATGVAVALLAVAGTGCGSGSKRTGKAAAMAVRVKLLAFNPGTVRVPVGTTVTWTDDEPVTHTVTSGTVRGVDATTGLRGGETPDGRFDGRLDGTGKTFSYRFTEAGEFSYFCSIHKGMNATVVVS
jgi:plastocyanin